MAPKILVISKNQSVRYVSLDLEPKEVFVGFYTIENTTGNHLTKVVYEILLRLNIDVRNLRGQTYDGAANMAGAYNGCQAIISNEHPLALFLHCGAHCSNLIAQSCCEASNYTRDAMHILNELGSLYSRSVKFSTIFKNNLQRSGQNQKLLKPICPTRWLVKVPAVQSTLSEFSEIVESLKEMSFENGDSAAKASGICEKLVNGNTILSMKLLLTVLEPLQQLNKCTQSSSMSISDLKSSAESTAQYIQTLRNENNYEKLYKETEQFIESNDAMPIYLPRIRNIPKRFENGHAGYKFDSAKSFFRSEYFKVDFLFLLKNYKRISLFHLG